MNSFTRRAFSTLSSSQRLCSRRCRRPITTSRSTRPGSPRWFDRAAVVFHELFHFFPGVAHNVGGPPEQPWDNARAYQGFVGTLAGMRELPGITAMFPP